MQQVAVHLENCKRRIYITCFHPSLLQSAILGVPYNIYVLLWYRLRNNNIWKVKW